MSRLIVKKMSHGFGDRVIFEDVSFRLLRGEHIGLIGANGEGKSSFMDIITGKLMPDEGEVNWANNIRVGYMDQHTVLDKGRTIREVLRDAFKYLFVLEEEMIEVTEKMGDASPEELEKLLERMGTIQDLLDNNGFYGIDSKIDEVAAGIGLKDVGLENVADLSGGQRTKILLAKLLLEVPDVLLLDEPTNFLDEQHVEWLKRYLQNYENAFILISHDIEFINDAINIIYHVENKNLTRYVGSYNEFLRVHEAKRKQMESDYERQQKEITKLEVFVAKNKARASTSGMAKARQKKLDKIDRMEVTKDKPKPQFNFKSARASGKILFKTVDLVTGYDIPLSKPLNLYMERGQKIALTGANGVGKTTLLKSLMGDIKAVSGKTNVGDYQYIGYYEQEIKGVNRNNCIEEFWEEFPSFTQGEVRSALARCGLTTKHIESKITVLSGGEQAKVRLAKLLNRETNILILDEPTNHLDVDAKDELKRALKEYTGSILIVCHEPEFYQDVVTDVWDCEQWTTMIV